MPIYAYKCSSCGHTDDVLQKISADPLTVCPACGQAAYARQVTAPQFQLKGSGWYVTDFRGGNTAGKEGGKAETAKSDTKTESAGEPKTETKSESAAACPVHSAPAPAASPAPAKPAAAKE